MRPASTWRVVAAEAECNSDGGNLGARVPQHQHDGGVHDVLRRGSVVQPGRHIGAGSGQLRQQRQDRVSHQPGALTELGVVDLDSSQLALDRIGGGGGNHTVFGLRPCQRNLDLQPGFDRPRGRERLDEPPLAEDAQQGEFDPCRVARHRNMGLGLGPPTIARA